LKSQTRNASEKPNSLPKGDTALRVDYPGGAAVMKRAQQKSLQKIQPMSRASLIVGKDFTRKNVFYRKFKPDFWARSLRGGIEAQQLKMVQAMGCIGIIFLSTEKKKKTIGWIRDEESPTCPGGKFLRQRNTPRGHLLKRELHPRRKIYQLIKWRGRQVKPLETKTRGMGKGGVILKPAHRRQKCIKQPKGNKQIVYPCKAKGGKTFKRGKDGLRFAKLGPKNFNFEKKSKERKQEP